MAGVGIEILLFFIFQIEGLSYNFIRTDCSNMSNDFCVFCWQSESFQFAKNTLVTWYQSHLEKSLTCWFSFPNEWRILCLYTHIHIMPMCDFEHIKNTIKLC